MTTIYCVCTKCNYCVDDKCSRETVFMFEAASVVSPAVCSEYDEGEDDE